MLDEAIRAERRAVLVVNTRSRSGRDLYGEAKTLLGKKGLLLDAAYPVRDPVRLPEIVQGAIAQGHRLIIVGGGDGTISSVVDYFAYRDVVLGILPLGTANSFARALGIPLDLAGAAEILTGGGKVADVDLGRINDDYFANTAAIGLPALVGRNMPHGLKRYFGKAGYILVGAALFARHTPFRAVLTAGRREIARIEDALDILIANGPYQGGVKVADEADPESRDLVIRIVKGGRKTNLLKTWAASRAERPRGGLHRDRPCLRPRHRDRSAALRLGRRRSRDPHPGPRLRRPPGPAADGARRARARVIAAL